MTQIPDPFDPKNSVQDGLPGDHPPTAPRGGKHYTNQDGTDPNAQATAEYQERLAMRERTLEIREAYELDADQAAEVAELAASHNLSDHDAVALWQARGGGGSGGIASLRPGGAPPAPQLSPMGERMEYARRIAQTDKRQARAVFNNICGSYLAKAIGWEHHEFQVPGSAHRQHAGRGGRVTNRQGNRAAGRR